MLTSVLKIINQEQKSIYRIATIPIVYSISRNLLLLRVTILHERTLFFALHIQSGLFPFTVLNTVVVTCLCDVYQALVERRVMFNVYNHEKRIARPISEFASIAHELRG